MIAIRRAPTSKGNAQLRAVPALRAPSNVAWLESVEARGGIVLIGGASLSHFRVRVAQSHLRRDLFPSFWSVAGILDAKGATLSTVSFGGRAHTSDVPRTNAVQTRPVADYDDPRRYPNIAWLRFSTDGAAIADAIERVKADRAIVDLPRLLLAWLGFAWGAGDRGNPLLASLGVPSASFVEAVYALAGIELTPGLSSDASCPEAIWQSVKWWREYYEQSRERAGRRASGLPAGVYLVRQVAAAVIDENGGGSGGGGDGDGGGGAGNRGRRRAPARKSTPRRKPTARRGR